MCFLFNNLKIHDFKIPHNEYIPAVDVYNQNKRSLIVPEIIPEIITKILE